MKLVDHLLSSVAGRDCQVRRVCIGLHSCKLILNASLKDCDSLSPSCTRSSQARYACSSVQPAKAMNIMAWRWNR